MGISGHLLYCFMIIISIKQKGQSTLEQTEGQSTLGQTEGAINIRENRRGNQH
jgi:hypothetical protein